MKGTDAMVSQPRGVTRREFLAAGSRMAMMFGLGGGMVSRMASAVQAITTGQAPVLWLQGSNCTGCSVSLLNTYPLMPLPLITKHISLKFHQTLSTTQGQQAVDVVNDTITQGGYVLVVEGAVPLLIRGACTFGGEDFADLLARAVAPATHVVAVGACASYGGIPSAPPNPIGAAGVGDFMEGAGLSKPLVNIPGCPPHPDWMVGAIVHLLEIGVPALDAYKRPTAFYGRRIHERCPLNRFDQDIERLNQIGQLGCMEEIGCRGKKTTVGGDCTVRGWNGGVSNCMISRGMCIGCTAPDFAKDGPFYHEEVSP